MLRRTALGFCKEAIVFEYERGVLFRDGKKERMLEPGRYSFWWHERVAVEKVSLRQMSQVVPGQEILTADRIEVRITLVAQYRVADPEKALLEVENYTDHLYQELQLALRDIIAGKPLDEVLEARADMGTDLLSQCKESAARYGIDLDRVGIRDIILPGEVRRVMMQEVQADREGRAELVKARHEVAAARARANTAKILSENPDVARLRELDALTELAGRQGSIVFLPNLAEAFLPRREPKSES